MLDPEEKFTIRIHLAVTAIFALLCFGMAWIGADLGAVVFGALAVIFGMDTHDRSSL